LYCSWEEVLPSLRNMVAAAALVREEVEAAGAKKEKEGGTKRPSTPTKPGAGAEARAAGGGASTAPFACLCCLA
jgi:hypothetical protein